MKGVWEHDVFFLNKTNMTIGIVRWESINVQILAQRLIAYILITDWGMRTLTQSSASTLTGSSSGWLASLIPEQQQVGLCKLPPKHFSSL